MQLKLFFWYYTREHTLSCFKVQLGVGLVQLGVGLFWKQKYLTGGVSTVHTLSLLHSQTTQNTDREEEYSQEYSTASVSVGERAHLQKRCVHTIQGETDDMTPHSLHILRFKHRKYQLCDSRAHLLYQSSEPIQATMYPQL